MLITVTAPNGSQKTYTVIVNRAAPASDNNLSALSVTGQTLEPAFAAGTLNYTVNVATAVTSVNVSATKSDPNAVMSGSVIAGTGVATGQATITLGGAPSSTSVLITVTAPNGSQKTYTIIVNRAAPAALTITTTFLPSGTVETAYSTTLSATGGTGPGTYTWTLAGDSPSPIPSGLTLSSAGVLSGTPTVGPPTAVGTHSLKFTVTDTTPQSVSATLSLTID